jgi:hypothetical protein
MPARLPRKQMLFLDALAHSFRAVERSYRLLQVTLAASTTDKPERALSGTPTGARGPEDHDRAVLDLGT